MIGWIFCRSDSLSDAVTFIGQLFKGRAGDETVLSFLSMKAILVFAAAVIGAGFIQKPLSALRCSKNRTGLLVLAERLMLLLVLALCLLSLINNSYNPFIYFQF